MFEPELHSGPGGQDILVPDLAGWRRVSVPEVPNAAHFSVAPDWICDVLSSSTRSFDLGRKCAIYAREQVSHLWLVDPDARTLEVFKLCDGQWLLLDTLTDNAPVSLSPFEAISFPLDALWPDGGRET